MKAKSFISILICLIFVAVACKKEQFFGGEHDPEVIKNYKNETASVSMDSIASINFITKQKLLEVYELSLLYSSKQNDSILKDVLHSQLASYFLKTDTISIPLVLKEMDSLQAKFIELRHFKDVESDSLTADSIRKIDYWVRYYSADKKLIDSLQKTAEFILKKEPKKFKNEFTFYFTNLNLTKNQKDINSSPVTQ